MTKLTPLYPQLPERALIVLIGASKAGKTTLARTWPAFQVLSLDTLRGWASDDEGCQEATPDVVDALHLLVDRRMARRHNTVVDATNVSTADRAPLVAAARRHGMPAIGGGPGHSGGRVRGTTGAAPGQPDRAPRHGPRAAQGQGPPLLRWLSEARNAASAGPPRTARPRWSPSGTAEPDRTQPCSPRTPPCASRAPSDRPSSFRWPGRKPPFTGLLCAGGRGLRRLLTAGFRGVAGAGALRGRGLGVASVRTPACHKGLRRARPLLGRKRWNGA